MNIDQPDFDTYQRSCHKELSALQDEFIDLYDINSYENWFYDHGTGVFNFKSDDGRNLYFKYVDVGSFSTNTNTWNWAWDNGSTPTKVTRGLEKVRIFGENNSYPQLITGFMDGDEYTGWELTVVSAKLLSAIGMYRIPHDHLFIYFIFTKELTEDEFEALQEKKVECSRHETGLVAFVCQHLINNRDLGFHEAFESDPLIQRIDDYQGWCSECEEVRKGTDGWNDESMAYANIKIVCDECYFEIKDRNLSDN